MQINGALILGAGVSAVQASQPWKGGKGLFTGEGTFNSGSVLLEMLSLNGTYLPVKNPAGTTISLSAAGALYFELPPGQIRMNVSGSPSAMYVYAVGIPQ